jgi:hypothetical protein
MVLLIVLLLGCGDAGSGPPPKPVGFKVSGKVLLPNGSPVTSGILSLRPESGLYGATASIGADGSFTLLESGAESIVTGKYFVYVRVTDDELAKKIPAKYQESSEDIDSDVVVDIQGDTSNLEIRLKN